MNPKERREAELLMRSFLPEAEDLRTGEFVATVLAEETAKVLNRAAWLDDDTHEIWDMAAKMAIAAERRK